MEDTNKENLDETRRKFLKTSAVAAFVTPTVLSMVVEKASAAGSGKALGKTDEFGKGNNNKF